MDLSEQMKMLCNVDDVTKDAVNGFIRNCQSLLPSKRAYFLIPAMIYKLCLAFYCEIEGFLAEHSGEGLQISGLRHHIITRTGTGWNTANGKLVIDPMNSKDMVYSWMFRVKRMNHHVAKTCIGITSSYSQLQSYIFDGDTLILCPIPCLVEPQ